MRDHAFMFESIPATHQVEVQQLKLAYRLAAFSATNRIQPIVSVTYDSRNL
jgi:hypothetical protein